MYTLIRFCFSNLSKAEASSNTAQPNLHLFIFLFPKDQGMQSVTYWLMGSLTAIGTQDLPVLLILIPVAAVGFYTQSRIMNTMMLGDETAKTLGVNTNRSRIIYMLLSALLIGFMVTKC